MTDTWQPIETAPKDGSVVLVYDADLAKLYRVQTAFWNDHLSNWQVCDDDSDDVDPTHWMPLPKPPVSP